MISYLPRPARVDDLTELLPDLQDLLDGFNFGLENLHLRRHNVLCVLLHQHVVHLDRVGDRVEACDTQDSL